MKDIINKNDKGELHGYQEYYWSNGELYYKGLFYNGVQIDYEEWYGYGGGKLEKVFYI